MYRESKELPVVETRHPCLEGWRGRIDRAEKRGRFLKRDRADAGEWDMCAVGEARKRYGVAMRGLSQRPCDSKLRQLGAQFFIVVTNDDIPGSRAVLAAIEQRLAAMGF